MQGTSGFSFVDLTADLAGVAFARHIKSEPTAIEALARKFAVEQYMPATAGLREGLSPKRFEADYGSVGDKRFTDAVDAIRTRVAECPGYVL